MSNNSNNYFAPNKAGTGGALFATFNSREGFVMLRLLKQIGAMGSDKVFDGQNPLFIKLSQDEVGSFVRTIRTNGITNIYHKFNDTVTAGSFKYYQTKDNPPKEGFGLTIKRNDVEIKIGFTTGSAERFSLFLQNALTHIFDAEHVEDVKKEKLYLKQKEQEKATKGNSVKDEYIPKEEEPKDDIKDENIDF